MGSFLSLGRVSTIIVEKLCRKSVQERTCERCETHEATRGNLCVYRVLDRSLMGSAGTAIAADHRVRYASGRIPQKTKSSA
jgi:hypothetical protein